MTPGRPRSSRGTPATSSRAGSASSTCSCSARSRRSARSRSTSTCRRSRCMQDELGVSATAVQLTLTGTMIGFGLGQLIVGPWSDKVGRRLPLILATALHIAASVAAAFAPDIVWLSVFRLLQGFGAAAGGVVAMAMVRDLFGGKPLVRMLSRLALVNGLAPVLAPVIGSQLLAGHGLARHLRGARRLRCRRGALRHVLHRRDPARVAPPRLGALDPAPALRGAVPRPRVPRRRAHRRHDVHGTVRLPVDLVVPLPGGLRLQRRRNSASSSA